MRKIPVPNDIRFDELQSYLAWKGYKNTGGKSSHYVYTYDQDGIKEVVNIVKPHGTSEGVKPKYIRIILDSIERIELLKSTN